MAEYVVSHSTLLRLKKTCLLFQLTTLSLPQECLEAFVTTLHKLQWCQP